MSAVMIWFRRGKQMRRKGLKGIALFMMILLLALTQMPVEMVRAEETFVKTKENTGLGTNAIENPVYMNSIITPWTGN